MRKTRRRRLRRKKRAIRKRGLPIPRQMAIAGFVGKIQSQLSVVGAGGAYNVTFSLHFPTYSFSNTNTWGQIPGPPVVYTRYLDMFDQYKVRRLTVRLCPSNVEVNLSSNNFGGGSTRDLYHYNDHDDYTNVLLANFQSLGVMPYTFVDGKQRDFRMSPRFTNQQWRNTSVLKNQGIGGINIAPTGAILNNFVVMGVNEYGSMKFLLPGPIQLNETPCRFLITWDVEFRGISA